MAIVRPFRGIRPKPELAAKIVSPPYDVLSSEEARELVKNNPDSFLRVNKSEVDFPVGTDTYGEQIYAKGKENLDRLLHDGLMMRDDTPCFYLYRLTWQGQSQTGLVALASVDEYDQGKIKKHEHTRPEKVDDRANHILALDAQVGPVFIIHRQQPDVGKLIAEITTQPADTNFAADDDVRHEFWVVKDDLRVDALREAFATIPEMYIADGHHRSESASEVCRRLREKNPDHTGDEPYNFFLTVIFPDDEVRILSYNRVVSDLNGLTPAEMLQKASDKFSISETGGAFSSDKPGQIGVYCDHKWYSLQVREGSFDVSDPVESIDSAILTRNFLAPVLDIVDLRTDKHIGFIGGIRGTEELVRLVDSGEYEVAFTLPPVSVRQLLDVADAGGVMPPKSTWFEPKLRSGMAVSALEE